VRINKWMDGWITCARRVVPVHCHSFIRKFKTKANIYICWNTKVVTRHSAYRWQQYDVIMTSWSSMEEVSNRYHQNFLLCNNNEITAYIADLFYNFFEEVYAVALFKVVQQQTIGGVGNSISLCVCGQIISVCNGERIIKIWQYLRKLCSNEKMSSFFDSHCILAHTVHNESIQRGCRPARV